MRRSDYPWIFCRDEVDVFEDELEGLYLAFRDDESSLESEILKEQWRTKENSERELRARLGPEAFTPPPGSRAASDDWPEPSLTDWQLELNHIRSSPLYQKAKQWTLSLKSPARREYENGAECAMEAFRIYANSNLVPLKIFGALYEEMHGDRLGLQIALEEYGLALTYLERIIRSLNLLSFFVGYREWIEIGGAQAGELREALIAIRSGLDRRISNYL